MPHIKPKIDRENFQVIDTYCVKKVNIKQFQVGIMSETDRYLCKKKFSKLKNYPLF